MGLLQPIRVRRIGDGYEVVAGSHRLQACDALLNHTEIACLVTEDDDLSAELAMIDENLMRAELSPAQRATQTARRKAIYEELHPQTRRKSTLMRGTELPSRQAGETGATRFTTETAAALRQKRTCRAARRGTGRKAIIPEVMTMIQGTKLDIGSYMDRIKGVTQRSVFRSSSVIWRSPTARSRLGASPPGSHERRTTLTEMRCTRGYRIAEKLKPGGCRIDRWQRSKACELWPACVEFCGPHGRDLEGLAL